MTIKTTPFDAAKYIETAEDAAVFLADALESGDAGFVQHVLGLIARSKGMSEVAAKAGLGRESLYKALKEDASPKFETILKVATALGIKFVPEFSGETAHAA